MKVKTRISEMMVGRRPLVEDTSRSVKQAISNMGRLLKIAERVFDKGDLSELDSGQWHHLDEKWWELHDSMSQAIKVLEHLGYERLRARGGPPTGTPKRSGR